MTEEEKFAFIPKEQLPLAMMLKQFQFRELGGQPQTGKVFTGEAPEIRNNDNWINVDEKGMDKAGGME